jgi:hypothetical protein
MKKVKDYINFIKEAVIDKTQLYFLHPKLIYGSRIEEQTVELINLYFDNPIIYNMQDNRGGFYKYAEEINTVVVLPYPNGKISPRTLRRLEYAFERLNKIYYLHPQKFKILRIEDLDFFTQRTMSGDELKERVISDTPDDYFKEMENEKE